MSLASRRAFEKLLTEHLDALYRTALQLCGGHENDAEDLLQETALRAFEGFEHLRDLEAGRSWLFTILTRTYLNRRRAARRRAEVLTGDLDERAFEAALQAWTPSRTPEDVRAEHRLRERFAAELHAMAPPLRAVVWLVDVEGFRQWQVAEMLGIPEGTVASRLYRARRRLRDALSESGRSARSGGAS